MIILDTQPVSQLQRRVIGRCSNRATDQRLFSPGRLDHGHHAFRAVQRVYCGDHAAKAPEKQLLPFGFLQRLIEHYSRRWNGRILSFDAAAATELQKFSPQLVRKIGGRDARIAAIALVHDATVLTANTRDFRLVPGLKVEDFT